MKMTKTLQLESTDSHNALKKKKKDRLQKIALNI